MTPEELKEKIQQAEESVSLMKDDGLKKIAFETMLSNLLSSISNTIPVGKNISSSKVAKKKRSGIKKPDTSRTAIVEKTSSISLDVKQLQELKSFYDLHAPEGTEAVVFNLAYFIHENLKQKQFHAVDIHLIYQNLLSLKPIKRPPAMSLEEVKRAVRWLVAPSRKKQWLKDTGAGQYEVSPQGMLRMTYENPSTKKNG